MTTSEPEREASLYRYVAAWLRNDRLSCFHTALDTGTRYGRIDVVGLRDTGGDVSGRHEVIAVEVKLGNQPFLAAAGQAAGYGVFANRCYLAERWAEKPSYADDHLEMASRLGIGLLAVTPGRRRVVEMLAAPHVEPVERFRLMLIEHLGFSVCSLCGSVFQRGDSSRFKANVRSGQGALKRAIRDDKGLMYWLWDAAKRVPDDRPLNYRRRYLCRDCVQSVFADLVPPD
jgi:hypothetical protein